MNEDPQIQAGLRRVSKDPLPRLSIARREPEWGWDGRGFAMQRGGAKNGSRVEAAVEKPIEG